MGSSTPSQKELYEAQDAALIEIRQNITALLVDHGDINNCVYRYDLSNRCKQVAKAAEALGAVYEALY